MDPGSVEKRKPKRLSKRTPVEIPASAREVKAIFWEEPLRAKVLEIVKYVSETGKAHLHPDVTYTDLVPGSEIRFLEVFDLVEKFKYDDDNWCVCAACHHDLPQFKDGGIVCWFPSEGIVRIIGGDCYKRLDPEGHAAAWNKYEADTKLRRDETYLLGALPAVPDLLTALESDLYVADALDRVRSEILQALQAYEIELWPHIKDGKLKKEERTRRKSHGSSTTQTIATKATYATIRGQKYLDPGYGKLAARFRAVGRSLETINFAPPHEQTVLSMTIVERCRVADALSAALKEIPRLRRELEDARMLISPQTKATLRAWSSLPNTTLPFFFDFSETELRIGMSGLRNVAVPTPAACYEPLAVLPRLARTKAH